MQTDTALYKIKLFSMIPINFMEAQYSTNRNFMVPPTHSLIYILFNFFNAQLLTVVH